MPLRAAKTLLRATVRYIWPNGRTQNAKVLGTAAAGASAPGMATATTGGTLAAGTFVYSVTAVVNGVETQASATGSQVTTGSTSTVTVTGAVVTGAQAYRFYGRTSGAGNQKFMVQQASNVFTDTGAITPSATVVPPAASSVSLQIPELQANRLIHGVPLATTVKQTGAYHSRDL